MLQDLSICCLNVAWKATLQVIELVVNSILLSYDKLK